MSASLQLQRQIAFHETDAAGVAHFTRILCWAEEAEHTLLRHLGLPVHDASHGWPRVHCQADYRLPLHAGETVTVHIAVAGIGQHSVRYAFEIKRGEACAATGHLDSCLVGMDEQDGWSSIAIPEQWRRILSTPT